MSIDVPGAASIADRSRRSRTGESTTLASSGWAAAALLLVLLVPVGVAGGQPPMDERAFVVGTPFVSKSPGPGSTLSIVFEDDGDTGYAYAVDTSAEHTVILDAVLVYDVGNVPDPTTPRRLRVRWRADGSRAGVYVDGHAEAVFDFVAKRAYCRSMFPPPSRWPHDDLAANAAALDGLE